MKKVYLFLLFLVGFFCGALNVNAAWSVTDTVIADGYYYIRSNYSATSNTVYGPGCLTMHQFYDYTTFTGPHVTNMALTGRSDLSCIWHIWRDANDKDGSPQYHIKNCGTQSRTYMYPHRPVAGQSTRIYATGRENDTYFFRTKDWGCVGIKNSKGEYEGVDNPWEAKMDRQDTPKRPSASNMKKYLASYPDSVIPEASQMFMIRPVSSRWRWRIGAHSQLKLNSFDSPIAASFYLTPVCFDSLTGKCVEWLQLNEAITDAKGLGLIEGVNPGNVNSPVALEAFETVLDEATTLFEDGGTKDEYVTMTTKVKAAQAEVEKYIVPLNGGYFYMKNHFDDYGGGLEKYATFFNDYGRREYTTSTKTPGTYPDDIRANMKSHRWFGETYWFGYEPIYDADVKATTVEDSKLPDKFIWKFTELPDGNYLIKNMAASADCGDSTYYFPTIRYLANVPNVSAWCQLPMRGTPQNEQILTWIESNSYRITQSDNYFPLNLGNHFFNTQNPVNSMTYGLWDFYSVPAERITAKFKLNGAITDAGGVLQDWSVGDKPGQIKESYVAELRAKLAEARELYANQSASDDECEAMTTALDAIYKATMETLKDTDKVQNPIADGYYFLKNGEDWNLKFNEANYYQGGITTSYGKNQSIFVPRDGTPYYNETSFKVKYKNTAYTLYANDEQQLLWDFNPEFIDTTTAVDSHELIQNKQYRKNDIYNAWKVTATGNMSNSKTPKPLYTVQNMATGGYLDLDASGQVYLSDSPKEVVFQNNEQTMRTFSTYYLQPMNMYCARGFFLIMDPNETYNLFCAGNIGAGGTAIENSTLNRYASAGTTIYSAYWTLDPIEGDVLDSLMAIGENKKRVIDIHNLLGQAEAALANATLPVLGDSLLKSSGLNVIAGGASDGSDTTVYNREDNQVWLNQNQWGEGSYANLIDGNLSTYVQSRWSAAGGPAAECTDYNAVIVDLKDHPSANIVFKHGSRGNTNSYYGPIGKAPVTYGVIDYGERYRLVDVVVYGTNDTLSNWNEVTYIKDIPAIKDQRIYTSPLITAPEPYRFYKFSVLKNVGGQGYLSHPHIAPSYFQVYNATADEVNSPTVYNTEVKTAVDALKPLVKEGWAAYKAAHVSKEQITNLTAATKALEAVVPNSWRLLSRIYDAKVLRDSAYAEDEPEYQQYGDVTEAEKANFTNAIETAETAMAPESHPTIESLNSAYDALNNAYFDFNAKRKTFETDTWYYITSTEYQAYHFQGNYAWRGNNHVYASGNIPQNALTEHKMGNIASPVLWGHYTGFNSMPEGQTGPKNLPTSVGDDGGTIYPDYTGGRFDDAYSPYSQWRVIALPEKGDSIYAIQNRANGLYLGRRQDNTGGTYNYVTLSKDPMPVQINLLGRNQYEIIPLDSTCAYYSVQADKVVAKTGLYPNPIYEVGLNYPLHSQSRGYYLVWWGTGTEKGYNTGSAYTFSKGSDMNPEKGELILDDDPVLLPTKNNSIKIVTLPYAVDFSEGIYTTNEAEAVTYALKNVNQGEEYTVELTRKDAFEAGEPFIIVTGKPEPLITDGQDSIGFYVYDFDTAENGYQFDVKPANGWASALTSAVPHCCCQRTPRRTTSRGTAVTLILPR